MSDANFLWRQVHAAFHAHQIRGIDRTPQMAMDRIAAKCIGLSFNPDNCDVQEEVLSLDDLKKLKRYHKEANPQRNGDPIIVLVYGGHRFVIDGNKRVNKWVSEEDATLVVRLSLR
jgi:hypothetical protein